MNVVNTDLLTDDRSECFDWVTHPKLFTYYTKVYHVCQEIFLPQVVRVGERARTKMVQVYKPPRVGTILACEKLARILHSLRGMHGAHTGYANKALLPGRDFLL